MATICKEEGRREKERESILWTLVTGSTDGKEVKTRNREKERRNGEVIAVYYIHTIILDHINSRPAFKYFMFTICIAFRHLNPLLYRWPTVPPHNDSKLFFLSILLSIYL